MQKNKDGMRYPSIDKLLSKIDSKYKLVYAASKVAHIIEADKLKVEGSQCVKSIGIAHLCYNRVGECDEFKG